jgi:hypothetical protein
MLPAVRVRDTKRRYFSRPEIKEHRRAYMKEYVEQYYSKPENKAHRNTYARQYYALHLDRLRQYHRERYEQEVSSQSAGS